MHAEPAPSFLNLGTKAPRTLASSIDVVIFHQFLSSASIKNAAAEPTPNQKQATHVSLNGLGYLYFHGLGVERSVPQALEYFERAREEDKENQNADVLFNLGLVSVGLSLSL